MTGTNTRIQKLAVTNPLPESVMRRVVRARNLPPGSQGLDVGCGIGLQAIIRDPYALNTTQVGFNYEMLATRITREPRLLGTVQSRL